MMGFKKKTKKDTNEVKCSENVESCKQSLEKLIELETKEFDLNSKLVSLKTILNDLAEKRDVLKEQILVDKKKFLSTEEMEDFSITEEIVTLQKQYAETQVKYKDENKSFKELKSELKLINQDQDTENKKIMTIIEENVSELSDIQIDFVDTTLTENEEKTLTLVEGDNVISKYINYLAKVKEMNMQIFALKEKKLEILEPLNQMINQEEFISTRVIELRKELNQLSDDDFLTNLNLWSELSTLKEKFSATKEKIIIKKGKYKEIALEISQVDIKKNFVIQLADQIKKDFPEKF